MTVALIESDACSVDGCDRPRKTARSGARVTRYVLCGAHRHRLKRTGDVQAAKPVGGYDPAAFRTYHGAHSRVKVQRGPAREHDCIRCGGTAADWAYRGGAEHEFSGVVRGYEMRWSGDPADYDPMCRSCHKQHDVALRAAETAALRAEVAALRAEVAELRQAVQAAGERV